MRRQKTRKALILISFLLFPITMYYFSPYVIVMGTLKGIVNGSFLLFAFMFISSLFFGRLFCGWVCPAGGLQEMCFTVNDSKIKKGDWVKYLIWIPWISTIVILAIKGGGYRKIDPFFMTDHGISIADIYGYITYYSIIFLLIIIPAFAIGRRSFCHHICWMAPFMIIGRKIRNAINWPSLQLNADADKCQHCHTCATNCPMSLNVEALIKGGKIENSECILCGTCIDNCKSNVIRYGFGQR
jgi:polyferredoxin